VKGRLTAIFGTAPGLFPDVEVISELGRGAETVVYRVRRHGGDYTLKVLSSADPDRALAGVPAPTGPCIRPSTPAATVSVSPRDNHRSALPLKWHVFTGGARGSTARLHRSTHIVGPKSGGATW
jgi:hypothetical protein